MTGLLWTGGSAGFSLSCGDVWFAVLWVLSSASLSQTPSLPSFPCLLFHSLIFPSGSSTSPQNKPAPLTSNKLRYFSAFLSLQPFVVGEHLWALSVSVTLTEKMGVIWSFGFKRKPPPLILPSHLCSLQISYVSPEIYGFLTTYRVLF